MKISNWNVNMYANSKDTEKLSIKRSVMNIQPAAEDDKEQQSIKNQFREQLKQLKDQAKAAEKADKVQSFELELSDEDYQKIRLLELILSELTGKEVKFIVPKKIQVDGNHYDGHVNRILQPPIRVERESVSFEKESSFAFEAKGSVTTEDGREIQFNLNMKEMRHIKYESTTTSISGPMVDPLVLNFDGKMPKLSDKKYDFDLDHDGTMDQISFLTKGSGFLAFDKNGDGIINDGSELFGTQTGSGFRDLAVYDEDGNGWIDENDQIFEGLRIFMKDDKGNDQLLALGEKGIGAIYLGSVASHFDLLASDFQQNGQVRESGIYLNEDGSAGMVHHLDIQL